ncbi:Vacuolar ATP synthase subunit C [Spraguea lophii 42_110]|uniref:Vacuolar ATP synthase subunit C n=1 Tax=Spraguea lophii (strain 42_110) TaxID=1358809 RepID=S7W8B9_SPRLO|nr:Vacuolar ATP synthase subunit C [Spraguea lophii 42_110]
MIKILPVFILFLLYFSYMLFSSFSNKSISADTSSLGSSYSLTINILGYSGILISFVLSTLGSIRALSCISKSVSGASILVPQVGTKSFFGIVICETNFITCGLIMCFTMLIKLGEIQRKFKSDLSNISDISPRLASILGFNQIYFVTGVITGLCSYASSISTGIICSAVTFMDAKDPSLFFKLVAMMFFSGAIGILSFVAGYMIISAAPKMVHL